jgi:hypothetical protein
MNSGIPGSLQDSDPKETSPSTVYQNFLVPPQIQVNTKQMKDLTKRRPTIQARDRNDGHQVNAIEDLAAPGPILSLAFSIFSTNDSFMSTCTTVLNEPAMSKVAEEKNIQCCSKPPLMDLLFSDKYSDEAYRDMYADYQAGSIQNPQIGTLSHAGW